MEYENGNNDKQVDLRKLYEGMNEQNRESLVRVADRLRKTQTLISRDKLALEEKNRSLGATNI
jgi:hypothetical protein